MSVTVPIYGFGGGGGVTGGTLTVTAPAGVTVEVSKDGKIKRKTANAEGLAVFKGLETGTWTLTITDGNQTATQTVDVNADYSAVIAFFAATINITYPSGSTCTCTDGTTTLTAPDTSGTWACVVPNTGEWTVTCTDGTKSKSAVVTINTDGQSASIKLAFEKVIFDASTLTADQAKNMFTVAYAARLTVTKEGEYIVLSNTEAEHGNAVWIKTTYDMTDVTELVAEGYAQDSASSFGIANDNKITASGSAANANYYKPNYVASKNFSTSNSIMPLPVNTVSGQKYVALFISGYNKPIRIKTIKLV